ncbi:transcriptional regulator BetI [Bermanella sp. R86510]|uniref:transcriptional regulator BetI n=1 Tax=unclassified Bermanella TaxID=2627862 RepID=UPI0037CC4908
MPKVGMKPLRQAQLIEATLDSVQEFGLHGTTISTISRKAGVSTGIISHYFGGKQGLLEATVRYLLQSLQDALMNQLRNRPSDDPMERLYAIVEANFSPVQVSDRSAKTWLAFWAQAMHDENLARLQRINEKRLLANLRYSLKALIPKEDVAQSAQAIAALIDGLWLRWALNKGPLDGAKAVAMCKQFIDRTVSSFDASLNQQ